jgi:hypothetical protein
LKGRELQLGRNEHDALTVKAYNFDPFINLSARLWRGHSQKEALHMIAKKTTFLAVAAFLLLQASWAWAQSETILFKLESAAGVYNGPSQKTIFTLSQPAFITKIWTYHWNDGRGAAPGRIGLKNVATGQTVGMWNAIGTYHMFDTAPGAVWPQRGDGPPYLRWTVQPNVNVPAGMYEVLDSDRGTWSANAEMRNMGCAWVYGVSGGGGGIGPSPPATPEVQPGQGLPVPGMRVAEVRFFEGPQDRTPAKPERVYLNSFDRGTTRMIFWELHLVYPHPSQRLDFKIDAVWYRPDGSEMARQTRDAHVMPEWTGSDHTFGRGWADAGHFTPGTYRVDFSVQNVPIASGNFHIVGGGGGIGPSPEATPQVQPTPQPMPTTVDVNGIWKSGNQTLIFYQEGQTIKVMCSYRWSGNRIIVWHGEGTLTGNHVRYHVHHTWNTATVPDWEDGFHDFTVSADGNTMNGTWGTDAVPVKGNWSLQRVGP